MLATFEILFTLQRFQAGPPNAIPPTAKSVKEAEAELV